MDVEAYKGGVYSEEQGRIYFVPHAHAPSGEWHYITACISSTGTVVGYANGIDASCAAKQGAYDGGVLDSVRNRIYFIPSGETDCTSFTSTLPSCSSLEDYERMQ